MANIALFRKRTDVALLLPIAFEAETKSELRWQKALIKVGALLVLISHFNIVGLVFLVF